MSLRHFYIIVYCVSLSFLQFNYAFGQQKGCTDPQAINYNPTAVQSDGSCRYEKTSYRPEKALRLPTSVKEISGMVFWNGKIIALNDGGNASHLFALDTSNGKVVQVIILQSTTNTDWEEITQDSTHFYIGDFGNNASGNRQDLLIYKFPKSAVGNEDTVMIAAGDIERIRFSYSDQSDYTKLKHNKTRFDCEAFVVIDNKLHLFSKNWQGKHSVHYLLPTTAGHYAAKRMDSLNTKKYIITGAAVDGPNGLLLTSYTKKGKCALFLVNGFSNSDWLFTDANKRKIKLPSALSLGQLESLCIYNKVQGWLASEQVDKMGLKVPPQLLRFSWSQWFIN